MLLTLLSATFLWGCSPAEQQSSPSPDVPEMSESSNTFNGDDVAEALVISTTHWINQRDIGDGEGPVSNEMLTEPQSASAGRNWLQYGGDYSNNRHSPIEQLSTENIDRLSFEWGFPSGTLGQFAVSPIVYDGIMYLTTSYNRLIALDARTGEMYWRYDHQQPEDLRLC